MDSRHPNLIIGGSPKCGSSSIFYWLSTHPEICASSVKETGFLLDTIQTYNASANYLTQGIDGYSQFFDHWNGEKILMEATPEYLIQQKIPFDAFRKMEQYPKVLFIFRKPSNRIYSAFKFHKYTTKKISSEINFSDYLKTDHGRHMIEISRYAKHLAPWIDFLGKEGVHVCLFEDLKADPRLTLEKISDWIGIEKSFWSNKKLDAKNKTMSIRNQSIHESALKVNRLVPRPIAEQIIKPIYYKFNARKAPGISQEEKLELSRLDADFLVVNSELESLAGLQTSKWK